MAFCACSGGHGRTECTAWRVAHLAARRYPRLARATMATIGTPSLDQLRVFLTVVESGSFSSAARRLGRATSATSYAISGLEQELRLQLFERGTTRRPQLTEAGRLLLDDIRRVSENVEKLRGKARRLRQGGETELRVAFDSIVSDDVVSESLRRLHQQFPLISLHVRVESLGASMQLVLDRAVNVAITGSSNVGDGAVSRLVLGTVKMVPVAAPGHALVGSSSDASAREHMQLVLTDRFGPANGADQFVSNAHTWRVTDVALKHQLLLDGTGWGFMSVLRVRTDLLAGRLIQLVLTDAPNFQYPLFAVHRTDSPPGPATSYLLSQLSSLTIA